jgi:hypothetical protein
MLLIGRDLWLGGLGYLAMVNLEENKVSRISYVSARSIDQLFTSGDFLWAQIDRHIYRIALNDLP